MTIPITEKLIQRHMYNWNSLRRYLRDTRDQTPAPKAPVITVSRQAGSSGRSLARTLAQPLDLEFQGQSMLKKIAAHTSLENSIIAQLDENTVSQANLWVSGVLNQRIFLRDQYHQALARVVTALAAHGGVVFLGRGANLILGANATLRLRVVASDTRRAQRIQERLQISKAEARAVMTEIDNNRDEFIRKAFRQEPGQPHHFDLTLNADRMSLENMVETSLLALLNQQTGCHEPLQEKTTHA